ncbi:hypothetical protein SNE40_001152 [Patella caerulea]|uniref:Tyr recombinase domain-containing protein n=1 Tax=Patella caerulea TaxID=87958 RepID=A0AAN8KM09_PATCE
MLAGAYRLSPSFDSRLPITVDILNKLIQAVKVICTSEYEIILFTAMFLFAFNAFARVGEICLAGTYHNLLQLSDVHIERNNSSMTFNVCFSNFKHNLRHIKHRLSFGHGPTFVSAALCLSEYLKARGNIIGPLFIINTNPIPRSYFDKKLFSCLSFCKLNPKNYKGHSFRIGAATHASEIGISDAKIRALGRWHSNAFKKYVRTYNIMD